MVCCIRVSRGCAGGEANNNFGSRSHLEDLSMSDQNMTRRDAVKLGGGALAAAGLSGAATGAGPAEPAPAKALEYPDFRGKTILFYTCKEGGKQLLTDPTFAMLAGRLFVTGKVPALGSWPDGLSAAVAWDSVDTYYVFDSAEDCQERWKPRNSTEGKCAEGKDERGKGALNIPGGEGSSA
jgi:hypothetical protein